MKQINDPVFGDLEYDESKKAWTKKIFLGIWGGDDEELDLMVKCEIGEEITELQRIAYRSYLDSLQRISKEIPNLLLSYFKDHYEDIEREHKLKDNLKYNVVDKLSVLNAFDIKSLFIDSKGNFGWLANFVWNHNPISVILSEDTPKIFKDWNVLKLDYARIDDEVFGEMFFDQGWCKWIKTDINGIEGEWVLLEAEAMFNDDEITPEQKANYQEYLQNEKSFFVEYPKVLLEYYKKNYKVITEIWDNADLFDKESMDEKSIKDLVQFRKLYFDDRGRRYGWLCECAWDSVYGLAIYFDKRYKGICIGPQDVLVI